MTDGYVVLILLLQLQTRIDSSQWLRKDILAWLAKLATDT